jgi:hypothetical protein
MAGGIQNNQAAWIAGRHEPGIIITAMDRRKYQSTTENPNSLTGPEILGLPGSSIQAITFALPPRARQVSTSILVCERGRGK